MNANTQPNSENHDDGRYDPNYELGVQMCKCGKNPSTYPHPCPYAYEIGGSTDDEYCECCDDCRHECCMDI